ncbi:hypothetical protein RclHR1_01330020 [Rhizophagus clarus]|nr:hypothetical protein RclHR1_01330020 [Rhizophagus clarus]
MGKFRSRHDKDEERSLLSPIFQTLKRLTPSFSNNCIIPCGTGLGLLSLYEVLASTRISKPDQGIDKFTEFGGWESISHVKNYVIVKNWQEKAKTIIIKDREIMFSFTREKKSMDQNEGYRVS